MKIVTKTHILKYECSVCKCTRALKYLNIFPTLLIVIICLISHYSAGSTSWSESYANAVQHGAHILDTTDTSKRPNSTLYTLRTRGNYRKLRLIWKSFAITLPSDFNTVTH